MTLEAPAFRNFEVEIIASKGKDRAKISSAKYLAEEYKHKLDYIMTRFVDDFGHRLDVHSKRNVIYQKFKKIKAEQYAEVTRFLRLISYYETPTNA